MKMIHVKNALQPERLTITIEQTATRPGFLFTDAKSLSDSGTGQFGKCRRKNESSWCILSVGLPWTNANRSDWLFRHYPCLSGEMKRQDMGLKSIASLIERNPL
ncbi:hypothetical protein [Thermoactinomyces mirandus]|uniref:hypothetical protein n=1 Tax=Thermoactinomyces mirandus TaxID=2756294 RepID=UPI001FEB09C6|nr:hypothetical protein [Thermoactinomyces mirandus]